MFGSICLLYFSSSVFLLNFQSKHICTFSQTLFSAPPQPPIALAPINCTQTAEPQTEGPSAKLEPQTTEATNQSEDTPEQPPQEIPPVENGEEKNKSN